jgi:hypothetical protein
MLERSVNPSGARGLLSAAADSVRRRARIAAVTMLVGAGTLFAAGIDGVAAQGGPAILIDGNAVVTGFSGATNAGGAAPADRATIDLNGPAARIVDLQNPGAPPSAQLLNAIKPFTVSAGQIGQVFAVALDNASPPNIYVAATSAYGLPIVVPAAGGAQVRAKAGATNARFMPGLFGPDAANGGPGSIWRIDGTNGEVTLFANVTLEGVPNSGPALGGLAFDPASRTIFAADRETGMIHRFDLSGNEVGGFDHGEQGRSAAGMAPVSYDPATRLDITSPRFRTDNFGTWGYAPDARLIYGLAVQDGRLYYAVTDQLQIWSVAISPNGFGEDARVEVTASPFDRGSEISKITFDSSGRMIVAERPEPTGAYDFEALAKPAVGRVLRYRRVTDPNGATAWQPVPGEYALGFPGVLRNGNGGVAIGYGYTPDGRIDRTACSAFLWSTGEQLRKANDPSLAARLAAGGPPNVDGLQGNAINLVRPANEPPLATYFVDYDDKFNDDDARGHLGDVAIWRQCGGQAAFVPVVEPEAVAFDLIGWGECRDRDWDRDGHGRNFRRRGGDHDWNWERRCCDWYWDSYDHDHRRRDRDWDRRCCDHDWSWDHNGHGRDWQRRCNPPPNACPPGTIVMPDGTCCDPKYVREGRCFPPPVNTCPPGTIMLPNGTCCDPKYVHDGRCLPPPVNTCPPGTIMLPNGTCCDPKYVVRGRCLPPPVNTCPPGAILLPNGQCCAAQFVVNGKCERTPPSTCPPGTVKQPNGTCQPVLKRTPQKVLERDPHLPHDPGRPVINGHNPTINIPLLPIKPNGGITRVPSNPIGGHGAISMPHTFGGLGGGKAIR